MQSIKKAIGYGVLVWFITLAIAMVLFSIRNNDRILFESIIPVILAGNLVVFGTLYFKKVSGDYMKEGFYLGFLWLAINIALDCLIFMWGPMKMTIADYIKDIGVTYLIMPIIIVGMGYLLKIRSED